MAIPSEVCQLRAAALLYNDKSEDSPVAWHRCDATVAQQTSGQMPSVPPHLTGYLSLHSTSGHSPQSCKTAINKMIERFICIGMLPIGTGSGGFQDNDRTKPMIYNHNLKAHITAHRKI